MVDFGLNKSQNGLVISNRCSILNPSRIGLKFEIKLLLDLDFEVWPETRATSAKI
jgi:hypothetical protein